MKNYIEVTGSAKIVEQVMEYRTSLEISVRAAREDTATSDAGILRDECIRGLLDAGLGRDQLSEGGTAIWRPWHWKKSKNGQEVSHKILVTCKALAQLHKALDTLEPLFKNERNTITVSAQQPRFENDPAKLTAAQVAAIRDARAKAEVIASETGLQLGAVAQVEDLGTTAGRSGAYGDESWGAVEYARGGGGGGGNFEELEGATRIRTVNYRVRFGVVS